MVSPTGSVGGRRLRRGAWEGRLQVGERWLGGHECGHFSRTSPQVLGGQEGGERGTIEKVLDCVIRGQALRAGR